MAQTKLRGPINYNAEGYVEVYYPEQLETAIRYNNSAKIKLMADIDVSHIRRICKTFTGSITGKHKEYSEELKDSVDAMYCLDGGRGKGGEKSWLFCSVENATFDHILFKNFRIEDDDYCSIGVIAKYAENSKFTNLAFENVSVFDNFDDAGVIAGHAEGCQFEKILTKFCDVTVDGECVGGLVGWSKNSIYTTCIISVTSAVYADGKVCWAHSGGIVGESQHDTFKECINMGLVGGRADKLGGIASSSDDSKFISCSNFNAVYFCKEADFRKAVDQIRERIKSLTPEDINKMGESYFKTIGIVGTSTFVGTFGLPLLAGTIYLCDAPALLGVLFALKTLAIIALAAAAIAVLAAVTAAIIMALTDYDEVGGICGCAEYSSFEGCVNSGTLYCDDSECGGIVGRAKGGTINNCLNTGKPNNDGEMSLGSIVGAVVCQTKITNCFSTQDAPIIGVGKIRGLVNLYSTPKDVSAESGNNYRLKNGNSNKLSCYEMQVTKEQMEDGTVALWLNNGAGNRNLPIKPWRQNLTGERDHFPILDKTHNEVKPKDLKHKAIRCEQDLREFAKMVNDGEQFYNAVLENDIKMSSNVWTPIGTKAHRWRGVFDGQGHTISGLKCSVADNSEEGAGLFGTVDVHADIRNVTLDASCEIEHKSSKHANAYGAGAIVGNVRNDRRGWGNVLIRGCGNYGKVTTSHHAGGILGRVINDGNDGDGSHVCIVVDSCFNAGEITAEGNSGLLCGYMQNYGIVYNCWSKGSLKQKGNNRVFDANNSRGEAEYFIGFDKTINITNCYDYQSKVDWNNLAADKRRQQGVEIVTNSALAHTVKFFAGNGTCATTSLTEANVRAGVILPVVTPLDGWTFAG
ncbi:MAG: hypothetical protein HUK07_03425, partial [Bacteroidaceae bacterium]|nr:hypothetical protein [Bacteroidaceae bacterium]